jgi:hypothetical protein
MTPEVFAKGNPCFHTLEKWPIWQNLIKSFSDPQMNILLSNSMYMNMVYFNSKNIQDLLNKKHGREVINKCREFSVELITKVIKPKQILCLGTQDCFDQLKLNNKEVVWKKRIRLLVKGELFNIPVYGIPHPSGKVRVLDEDRKQIGELLKINLLT